MATLKHISSNLVIFPDSRLTPCLVHVRGFGTWDTVMKGKARRGDYLHVIWRLGNAPLATLRIRVVVHILATRKAHFWCKPASHEDQDTLLALSKAHDLALAVSQLWVVRQ